MNVNMVFLPEQMQEAAALAGVTSGTITKWIQMGHFSSAGAGRR